MISAETRVEALPRLREEIRLIEDAKSPSGAPNWTLIDPVRDQYFAIGLEAFQLMAVWEKASDVQSASRLASDLRGQPVSDDEIREFAVFLSQSQLTVEAAGGWRALSARADEQRHGLLAKALHNYLFFKVPLIKPADFLARTLPTVQWLVSPVATAIWVLLTLAGVYLASRQHLEFSEGLARQLSFSGAALFAVTLFVMKIFHELGHAYVATAMGVRVRSMGVAVMLLAPMLYTDVSDAWRLSDRRKRMAIDLAGVAVELAVAGIAILLWALMPPGQGRDVLLVVATAAIVMTAAVNLSPFMRFDGYYVLADVLGVRNLQPRAFALVRWWLRELLFGLRAPCPDTLSGKMRSVVIAYGIVTMLYRIVLYVGIAVLVYFMTFKALGLFLFAVEVAFFMVRPMWSEIRHWWVLRRPIVAGFRVWLSTGVAAVCLGAVILPWSTQVNVPAILEHADYARLFSSAPAEIREVRVMEGETVEFGQILFVLASTRLEKEMSVAEGRLALLNERIGRRIADTKDQASSLALEKERISAIEKVGALQRQMDKLSIHAPFAGRLVGLDPDLHVGRIVSREDDLGVVVGGNLTVVRGYAHQQDLWRLSAHTKGWFIPDDGQGAKLKLSLSTVAVTSTATIELQQLAETHGGSIRVQPQQPGKGVIVPIDPMHLVQLAPVEAGALARPIRGVAVLDGKPESFAAVFFRRVMKVLVQEAGA